MTKRLNPEEAVLIHVYWLQDACRRLRREHGRDCRCETCRVRRGSAWALDQLCMALENATIHMSEEGRRITEQLAAKWFKLDPYAVKGRKNRRRAAARA